ncbi:MAG: lysylphosphatidylglycerol synthase domain-containing protein [Mycoplasma sp.]
MNSDFLKRNMHFNYNDKNFLTPKRLALIIFGILLFSSGLILSFLLLEIKVGEIFTSIGQNIANRWYLIFPLFGCLLFPFVKMMFSIFYIRPAMINEGIHISWFEYVCLGFKIFFINSITPFASAGGPYSLYWMSSRNASLKTVGSLTLTTLVFSLIGEILLTIPSFIIMCLNFETILIGDNGVFIFSFIVIGLFMNFVFLTIWVLLGTNKKFHYWISLFSNWFLKKIGKKALSKEEVHNIYIVQAEFQKQFYIQLKKWKRNLSIMIFYIFISFFSYVTVFFSFLLISNSFEVNWDTFSAFYHIANVSLTANIFIPIPSGEGTIQLTIGVLSKVFFQDGITNIFNSVGWWKISTNYIPLLISVLVMSWYYTVKIIYIKRETKKITESKDTVIKIIDN